MHGGLISVDALKQELVDLRAHVKAFDGTSPDDVKASKTRIVELETQLSAEGTAKASVQASADRVVFRTKIADAFVKAGGRVDAMEFVTDKAKASFSLKDGQLVTTPFSSLRPGELLDLDEWLTARMHDAPYTVLPSSGGGAHNSKSTRTDKRVINAGDSAAFSRNIEDIASGKVTVE